MALTEEQAKEIKEHLLSQLSNFPEDKRSQIKEQIESMTENQLENFIQQNQLTHLGGQCIFCSIIAGETKSFKLAENKENIAILEINPLSKGHALIVPKDHTAPISQLSKKLSEDISKRLKAKFNPKEIKTKETTIMNHKLLELIPIYDNKKPLEKVKESEEMLNSIKEEMLKPIEEPKIEKKKEPEKLVKLPPRIP